MSSCSVRSSVSLRTDVAAPGGARSTIDGDFYIVRFDPDMVVQWGRFLGSPGSTEQTLRVRTDAEGNAWIALYPMQRQADGVWRINGCQLARLQGQRV